jgi:hypothetical protein
VLKEYNLSENLNPLNVRIRYVCNKTYKMLESFSQEEKTLEEANIFSHKTYGLEIKKDLEEFIEYNPNIIVLNICKWNEDITNFHIEEKDLKFEKLKIDKKKNMLDLKNLIYDFYAYDRNLINILVIKKVELGISNYQVSQLFLTLEELEKEISLCGLVDNTKLFIEIKVNENYESYFIKYFDDNCANIIVKFNFPVKIEDLSNKNNLPNKTGIKKAPPRITINSYKFENQKLYQT